MLLKSLFHLLPLLALLPVHAAHAQATPAKQDPALVRQAVEQFLQVQSAGLPGQVSIAVGQVDPRTNLAACPSPEAFLPPGGKVWGKTTVGVRCTAPSTWILYVQATVSVLGEYVATAAPVSQGQVIGASDIVKARGDLTTMPNGIVTDAAQAVGRTMGASLPAGTPLRADLLKSQMVIQQGQVVKIVTNGPGFSVSGEGRALTNGSEGQTVQARTQAGQVISGVARSGGVVEVAFKH